MTAQDLFEYLSVLSESERRNKKICYFDSALHRCVGANFIVPENGIHFVSSQPNLPKVIKLDSEFLFLE